jgi:GDPmannose 4,6-dehydratase
MKVQWQVTTPRPQTALIFGISEQDGAYLAASLLQLGFEVHGTSRDKENSSYSNLRCLGIYDRIIYH